MSINHAITTTSAEQFRRQGLGMPVTEVDGGPSEGVDRREWMASRGARHRLYLRLAKPVFDMLAAALLLIVLSPLWFGTAVAVIASMGRPVIFSQQRVGRGGKVFRIYKFRTMLADRRRSLTVYSDGDRRVYHKSSRDPRHTRIGLWLRKWSLDELPQLLNVLRGDMSLVGPRPEVVEVVNRYETWQHGRHVVKPGLTGMWQVIARGEGPMHEHASLDLAYVERCSLALDFQILLQTIPTVLGRRPGA
ncbi:MAG: sugar transferase [Chloroflexi bacterium]|nr:sugar transferase [Chloroflexota bacterium]